MFFKQNYGLFMVKKKSGKPRVKQIKCKGKKGCGFEFHPNDVTPKKTWTLTSPMPDANGNITITLMASWNCPNCGKSIIGAKGKTKGEFKSKSKRTMLEEKLNANEQFEIAQLAQEMGYKQENVEKMVGLFIQRGFTKGKIEDGKYIPA